MAAARDHALKLKIGKPTKIEGHRWTYEAGGEKLFLYLNEASIVVDVQPNSFGTRALKR